MAVLSTVPPALLHSSCAAGEEASNSWICNKVYDWTGDVETARLADAVLGGTFKVLTIAVAALVIRYVLFRVIDRVTDQIVTSPSTTERQEGRFAALKPDTLLAAATPSLMARRAQRARTLGSVLKSIANVLIGLISALMIMEVLGYPIGPLLASAGIIGVALGFGAQTVVKDFISGVFMLMEDQFGVGDLVDMGEAIGTVEAVSLRITRLRDVNGAIWYVRNGEVLRVQNQSQGWSKATVDVVLPPDVDLTRVTTVLLTVAKEAREDKELAPLLRDDPEIVSVESITPVGANLRLQLTTQPLQGVPASRALRVRVHKSLAEAGIPLAHPAWQPSPPA
jgi:small-conductance mechanosensitive channel